MHHFSIKRIVRVKYFFACLLLSVVISLLFHSFTPVNGAPYGKGKYGDNVPYGSETSLMISTSGDITLQVTPTDAGTLSSANNVVTVTSTDVVGYKLYIRAFGSTDMTNGPFTLSASANGVPAPLGNDTWGYNIDASTDFTGITSSDVLIKTANGPYGSGDNTTVTYGIKVTNAKPAGNYTTAVVYTAAPQTE